MAQSKIKAKEVDHVPQAPSANGHVRAILDVNRLNYADYIELEEMMMGSETRVRPSQSARFVAKALGFTSVEEMVEGGVGMVDFMAATREFWEQVSQALNPKNSSPTPPDSSLPETEASQDSS